MVAGLETVAVYCRSCLESSGSPLPCVKAEKWHIRASIQLDRKVQTPLFHGIEIVGLVPVMVSVWAHA